MVQGLLSQSSEIQKVLTFEGAFEKLFGIITQEGGIEGGVVTRGALACVDSLLRFNSSNQACSQSIISGNRAELMIATELLPRNASLPRSVATSAISPKPQIE